MRYAQPAKNQLQLTTLFDTFVSFNRVRDVVYMKICKDEIIVTYRWVARHKKHRSYKRTQDHKAVLSNCYDLGELGRHSKSSQNALFNLIIFKNSRRNRPLGVRFPC